MGFFNVTGRFFTYESTIKLKQIHGFLVYLRVATPEIVKFPQSPDIQIHPEVWCFRHILGVLLSRWHWMSRELSPIFHRLITSLRMMIINWVRLQLPSKNQGKTHVSKTFPDASMRLEYLPDTLA